MNEMLTFIYIFAMLEITTNQAGYLISCHFI